MDNPRCHEIGRGPSRIFAGSVNVLLTDRGARRAASVGARYPGTVDISPPYVATREIRRGPSRIFADIVNVLLTDRGVREIGAHGVLRAAGVGVRYPGTVDISPLYVATRESRRA